MDATGSNQTSRLRDEPWSAEYLGTTPSHLRRLRVRGELPHVRIGRKVRYHLDDLDAFIDAQRHTAA